MSDDQPFRPVVGYKRLRQLGDGGDPRVDEDAADAADDGKAGRMAPVDIGMEGTSSRIDTGRLGGGHHSRVAAQVTNALLAGGSLDIRGKIPADIPYITSSWLRANRDSAAARFVGNDVYFANHHAILERLWADPGVTWMVLVYGKNPNFILGFMCAEASDQGPVIHWVHVRPEFRRMGFARRMVETFLQGQDGNRVWYTTSTASSRGALAAAGANAAQPGAAGWELNPYMLWRWVR